MDPEARRHELRHRHHGREGLRADSGEVSLRRPIQKNSSLTTWAAAVVLDAGGPARTGKREEKIGATAAVSVEKGLQNSGAGRGECDGPVFRILIFFTDILHAVSSSCPDYTVVRIRRRGTVYTMCS